MMIKNTTPVLPDFPVVFFRSRRPRAERLRAAVEAVAASELRSLQDLLRPWLDCEVLKAAASGPTSRDRVYNVHVTFFGLLLQALGGLSCTQVVKRIQSWMLQMRRRVPSSNNSAYVQARQRFPQEVADALFASTVSRVQAAVLPDELWHGRHVKVADGTGLSMADTPQNQRRWPQTGAMKAGCGFPQLRLTALFSLCTGAMLGWAEGNKHDGEQTLFLKLWGLLDGGDILLGDRAYCNYATLAGLHQGGVDVLVRLHQARNINWPRGIRLGKNDRLMRWRRPLVPACGWGRQQWNRLPKETQIRVLKINVGVRGFRSRTLYLATTLTDPVAYPAADLAALYARRWAVELNLRDIKITMGMDILAGKSPEQIRKDITLHAIGYNLIRGLMQRAAGEHGRRLPRLSFAAAVSQFSEWLWLFLRPSQTAGERRSLQASFHAALVDAPIPSRPNRVEPRAQKRRPRPYKLLNKPRLEMRRDCYRNSAPAKSQTRPLS